MSPRRTVSLIVCLGVLVACLGACGGSDGGGTPAAGADGVISVDGVTIDFPPNPSVAAVRMYVHNETASADELLEVTSPVAASAEMHRSTVDDEGQARMEEITALPVAARSTVTFEPAGLHVMLTGITADLQVGDEVPLVLTFAEAGEVQATALVVEPGTAEPQGADDGEGDHAH